MNYLLLYACTKFIQLCSFQLLSKQTEASPCYQSAHDENSDAPHDEMPKNASNLQEVSVSCWRLPLNFCHFASRLRHLITPFTPGREKTRRTQAVKTLNKFSYTMRYLFKNYQIYKHIYGFEHIYMEYCLPWPEARQLSWKYRHTHEVCIHKGV